MRPTSLPFRPAGRSAENRPPGPDAAFAALPLFRKLADALPRAARFRNACRAAEARSSGRWDVPPLFFFHRPHQSEWESIRPVPDANPVLPKVAAKYPDAAAAWAILHELLAEATARLCETADVRHAARAVPRLREGADELADELPVCRELVDLLSVPDDEVIRIRYPDRRFEARVRVRGVATIAQFHVLLADTLTGPRLPGRRPSAAVLDAARNGVPPGADPPVARAAFQFLRPDALRSDGSPPTGFDGVGHWLWGWEPMSSVPVVNGDRTVLLAPPAYPAEWEMTSRFPVLQPELDILEIRDTAAPLAAAA
jgi:hypothetical protein